MRWIVAMLLVVGCAHKPAPAPAPSEQPIGQGSAMGLCPLVQMGAQIAAEDTPDGVALAVSAPESQRVQVRQYLRDAAARHEQQRVAGKPHREMLPPHSTSVEDTDQGARLIFRPDVPEQQDALRQGVRQHVAHLETECAPHK